MKITLKDIPFDIETIEYKKHIDNINFNNYTITNTIAKNEIKLVAVTHNKYFKDFDDWINMPFNRNINVQQYKVENLDIRLYSSEKNSSEATVYKQLDNAKFSASSINGF